MLKDRFITAVILAAIFVSAVFFLPWQGFAVFVGIVLALGAWEWAHLSGFERPYQKGAYVVLAILLAVVLGVVTQWTQNATYFQIVMMVACSWWALSLLWIQGYPSSAILWGPRPVRLVMGLMVLLPAWLGCVFLRSENAGSWLVLLVMLLTASADVGAYFTGRAFGRRKLAPQVSPGKSWEGVFGGALLALTVALIFNGIAGGGAWIAMLVIAVPTTLVSVVGDLLESMVKRHQGVKDSSHILPGHGGILDRVDGLVAAIPVFALTYTLSQWRL